MNIISKKPLAKLGYDFIDPEFLPPGENEYYLRNIQSNNRQYRNLSASEIEILVKNDNTSSNWNDVLVTDKFDPNLVMNCHFYGMVRIGNLEAFYLEYHDLGQPVGIYNSTIVSCDIGSNVAINNVRHLAHYILGDEVILLNIDEMLTTSYAKFGNGMIKDGEDEDVRIWIELANENGGRKVIPFESMLPGDAYLWSKFRDDAELMDRFQEMCEKDFDPRRGFYGTVGDRCVIKDCRILKDVKISSDAYIKGGNKLKNLSILSSPDMPTQIGEGCELVNGIIGYGCRIFYGVKAVRFILRSASSLKYGARLINSMLGDNSTISCCEVLNSLIFPGHEQHHNNSFLCASMVMGQSNIAAGATIGSNHNSRGSDGEIVAERGFWPGLCVSLKHNSRFAPYTLLVKGSYPSELNIQIPFSLVSNDEKNGRLIVMPAYWFLYNMYAVARNAWKYDARDKRKIKEQKLEFDFLAPDTADEISKALEILEEACGNYQGEGAAGAQAYLGREFLLHQSEEADKTPIPISGFESSKRPVVLVKCGSAYKAYIKMLRFYAVKSILYYLQKEEAESKTEGEAINQAAHEPLTDRSQTEGSSHFLIGRRMLPEPLRCRWYNVGGQLIPDKDLQSIKERLKNREIETWADLHEEYGKLHKTYIQDKTAHALAKLLDLESRDGYSISTNGLSQERWTELVEDAKTTYDEIVRLTTESRRKDYNDPFRKITYENDAEIRSVMGSIDSNSFIKTVTEQARDFKNLADTDLKKKTSSSPHA